MVAIRPKWLASLESASDGPELLGTIPNAEAAALQGFLQRHGLPDPGLQLERARIIEEHIGTGSLTFKDLFDWRDDVLAAESAVEGIQDFRKRHPLIEKFRRAHDLDAGKDEVVLDAILKELWRGTFTLQEWVEFLDERREETDRHLFLFRLPAGNLQPPTPTPGFVWKAKQPVLVNLTADTRQEKLKLDWVGWRSDKSGDGKGKRSLTFVRIDLKRRTMELQLQLMRKGGTSAQIEERDLYIREVARLLHVQPEPLHLEPAIRSMLKDKRLTLESWMVRTPKGGHLRSKGEPGLFEKLKLGLLRFYALELKGDWKVSDRFKATVWMNARTDAIDIRTQCEPALLAELISTVSRYIQEEPQRTSLDALETSGTMNDGSVEGTTETELVGSSKGSADAIRRSSRKIMLEKVVEYHRRLGEDVDITHPRRESTTDLLFSAKTLEEAISEFGVRFLGVTFYVLCPQTSNPVRVAGRMTQYETLDEIPEKVDCENGDETHSHLTKGNVWLKIGPERTVNGTRPKWSLMIFALIFALSFAALSWFFTRLLNTYPHQKWFIIFTWAFAALAPVVAIRWLWGRSAFEGASNWIRTLAETSLSQRGGSDNDDGSSTD